MFSTLIYDWPLTTFPYYFFETYYYMYAILPWDRKSYLTHAILQCTLGVK